jgi:hypothetical protein
MGFSKDISGEGLKSRSRLQAARSANPVSTYESSPSKVTISKSHIRFESPEKKAGNSFIPKVLPTLSIHNR